MSRVKFVYNNRKELVCGKCREKILKGAGYRWTKPRYGSRKVRCLKPACAFKPSDLSSSKAAIVHDAIEDARDQIQTAESHDDLQAILQSVADVAREVGDEYRDASSSWARGNGHPEFDEKADACESFADELESWSFSDGETDEETVKVSVKENEPEDSFEEEELEALQDEAWEDVLDQMRSEAESVLETFDL